MGKYYQLGTFFSVSVYPSAIKRKKCFNCEHKFSIFSTNVKRDETRNETALHSKRPLIVGDQLFPKKHLPNRKSLKNEQTNRYEGTAAIKTTP